MLKKCRPERGPSSNAVVVVILMLLGQSKVDTSVISNQCSPPVRSKSSNKRKKTISTCVSLSALVGLDICTEAGGAMAREAANGSVFGVDLAPSLTVGGAGKASMAVFPFDPNAVLLALPP